MGEMKGKSPFYPGHPIPPELFTGRAAQIKRIKTKGMDQVAAGKPVAMFVQGEYGIGKSSVANYMRAMGEQESGCWASGFQRERSALGLRASRRSPPPFLRGSPSPVSTSPRAEAIREWFARYLKEVKLFGVTWKTEALKKDAANMDDSPAAILSLLAETMQATGEDRRPRRHANP